MLPGGEQYESGFIVLVSPETYFDDVGSDVDGLVIGENMVVFYTVVTDLFFEDWDASYGSPYLIGDDQPVGAALLAEDADGLRIAPASCDPRPVAFVDGVRRGEAAAVPPGRRWGARVRGTVGEYGCGQCCASRTTFPSTDPSRPGGS